MTRGDADASRRVYEDELPLDSALCCAGDRVGFCSGDSLIFKLSPFFQSSFKGRREKTDSPPLSNEVNGILRSVRDTEVVYARRCVSSFHECSVHKFLVILRKNNHGVWPDTDCSGAGKPIDCFLMDLDIRGGMIGKIGVVVI